MADTEKLEVEIEEEAKPEIKPEKSEGIDYEKLASILDGRQKANEDSVLKGYFKDKGITGEEAAQAIEAFKQTQAAKQPDIAGMQREIADLKAAMETANQNANVAKVENAVIVEAMKMGIDPKAIPYLTRMADLTNVGVNGQVNSELVAQALSKVLDDLPALKPTAQETGFKVGAGEKDQPAQVEQDKLKAMFGVK